MTDHVLVDKWLVTIRLHDLFGDEPVSREATFRVGRVERDIYFDTMAEAEEYMTRHVDPRLGTATASLSTVYDDGGVNYKDVKKHWAAQAEADKVRLKPCPFCGAGAVKVGLSARCPACEATAPADRWNRRQ